MKPSLANKNNLPTSDYLVDELKQLINNARQVVSVTVNVQLTLLYWNIGNKINLEILKDQRAEYGKEIVATVSQQLMQDYGKGFSYTALTRMCKFAQEFNVPENVATLSQYLSWSHFIEIIALKDELQKSFYAEMCRIERWSVRTLREKIDGMLFERTAISKKPDDLIRQELKKLRENNTLTPDLVFRDPYFLDFLGLKNTYSEKNLEDAILHEMEHFILELGQGFTFIERQMRMVIDGIDFRLDLLFYHRKLKRLVAIDLKLTKFKAAYKGQMELYLRYLERHHAEEGEQTPIGLILCAEGSKEQIELLQLEKTGIKVAEYLTQLPPRKLLEQKLHQAIELAKNQLDHSNL
jgi:predicted nuclease of restriction endonuclease-like (RecB) superfamily